MYQRILAGSAFLAMSTLVPTLSYASRPEAQANCTINSSGLSIDGEDRAGQSFTLSVEKNPAGKLEVFAKGFGLEDGKNELKMTVGAPSAVRYGIDAGIFEHPYGEGEKILIGGEFELLELGQQTGDFEVQVKTYRRMHADVYQKFQGTWESGMYWMGTSANCSMSK